MGDYGVGSQRHNGAASLGLLALSKQENVMPINAIKRASTTQKVTLGLLAKIDSVIMRGYGVIVRMKGVEVGLRYKVAGGYMDDDGTFYTRTSIFSCTVRKGLDLPF